MRVMIEIRKDIDNEAARSKALNLSPEEIAFYDAVAANVATLFDEKTLCDLIREVVQAVKKNLKVDWLPFAHEVESVTEMSASPRRGEGESSSAFLPSAVNCRQLAEQGFIPLRFCLWRSRSMLATVLRESGWLMVEFNSSNTCIIRLNPS